MTDWKLEADLVTNILKKIITIYIPLLSFFPRMCVYNDTEGWQNKQFLGTGEFTLPFGDYDVKISVPTDHIVAATGELVNAKEILTPEQIERLEKAKNSEKEPVFIVNEKEAIKNEKGVKKVYKSMAL